MPIERGPFRERKIGLIDTGGGAQKKTKGIPGGGRSQGRRSKRNGKTNQLKFKKI